MPGACSGSTEENVPLRNEAAIVGIGYTVFSRESGETTTTLALRAILAALDDAGLTVDDVDGLASFSLADSTAPTLLPRMLGLQDVRYYVHQLGGGSASHTVVGEAAMAVATGVADVVVCYRALNDRSGIRFGQVRPAIPDPEGQFLVPQGCVVPVQQFAMMLRAHMAAYGTTEEHTGAVAVTQRSNAVLNDRAMMREPMTFERYLSSPWISEPLRRFDCCLETDGACAVVVTSRTRAAGLRQRPVLVRAAGWGPGHTRYCAGWEDLAESGGARLAPRLYRSAGISPDDIDVAMLYDAFTYSVIVQLEDYGFCQKGDAGPFVAAGGIARDGALPVNTHGGLLSEGYIHGLNHVCEAVSQLRGHAGARQIDGASLALSTGEGGMVSGHTSALILERGEGAWN
jgi:acetyl-CoA acetyltransferase